PLNEVVNASTQLSGRLVFASLAQPEGPYIPSSLAVGGVGDLRGVVGPSGTMALGARLNDDGAVITGHVLKAEGTPIPGAPVVYANHIPSLADSAESLAHGAFSAVLTDAAG